VVILDYGAGGTMKKDWGDLAATIAAQAKTRVCAYDRAGRGLSDPASTPRNAAAVASDIDQMLTAAKIATPVVLVGHSLGSYHVRQFANTYADKTAGLVLVDPSGDGQMERFNAVIPKIQQVQDEMTSAHAKLNCIATLLARPVPPDDPLAQQCGGNDPDALSATRSEVEEMPLASTKSLVATRRSYGDMPLIVLTRGDYDNGMPPNFTAAKTRTGDAHRVGGHACRNGSAFHARRPALHPERRALYPARRAGSCRRGGRRCCGRRARRPGITIRPACLEPRLRGDS
jgi:pimeloyl-ACP methyl ester carboxylesterase